MAVVHRFQHQIDVRHVMTKISVRRIGVVTWNDAFQFAFIVTLNIRYAVGGALFFNQVDELRRVPMEVRVDDGFAVVMHGRRSNLLRTRGVGRNQGRRSYRSDSGQKEHDWIASEPMRVPYLRARAEALLRAISLDNLRD